MGERHPKLTGRRNRLALAFIVAAAVLALGVQPGAIGAPERQRGGIFRITFAVQARLDHIDPALSFTAPGWAVIDTTCARLMTYPDRAPPAGFRLVPEIAAHFPKMSQDSKTFTFTLRRGFRFSDGKPVRASAFARAINRTLDPSIKSPGEMFTRDIVGAAEVLSGRRRAASGVEARGNTLIVRFTRPAPDFPALTTLPFFCAVPPALPTDPEGWGPFPTAGPYRVVDYRPGDRVLLRRNRFYGGRRPHHVDGFDVDLKAPSPREMIQRIERGEADWGHNLAPVFLDRTLGLPQKYGINRSQLFLKPGLTLSLLVFNNSRPLLRANPKLRRAVNFALDRQALRAVGGGPLSGRLTDQYVPPIVPGFRNAAVYPLQHPDLRRARELARGNLRGGVAVLYTPDFPPPLAVAQLAKQQLTEIGLDVRIRAIPEHIASAAYLSRLAATDEAWDLALVVWAPNIPDPSAYINVLLDGQNIGGTNFARFSSNRFDADMRRAARLREIGTRRQAYGALDARLARDAAPFAAIRVLSEPTFVSKRVDPDCIILRPQLDLTAVCLK